MRITRTLVFGTLLGRARTDRSRYQRGNRRRRSAGNRGLASTDIGRVVAVAALAGGALITTAACSDPLELRDWKLPPAMGREGQGPGEPAPVGDDARRRSMDYTRERHPELTDSNFTWPSQYGAIDNLGLDGAGNLYVFPHAPRWPEVERADAHDLVPVDVYAPDGERLFAGNIAINGWGAALGDHVYRIETDEASDEQVVARYRIASPPGNR